MSKKVIVADYGMGNLRSVSKALEKVGADVEVTADVSKVSGAERLVLPGVGAFGKAVENLQEAGLIDALKDFLQSERPFLGICLGLQLLFQSSEEEDLRKGLGVIPGTVKRFREGLKVPHMGWNTLKYANQCTLFDGVPEGSYVYFVHSYYVVPTDDTVTACTTDYGTTFVSAVCRDNIAGVQFHPEKSQNLGLRVLINFMEKM